MFACLMLCTLYKLQHDSDVKDCVFYSVNGVISVSAVRGSVHRVEEEEDEDQASVVVSLSHVYRQKSRVFVSGGGRWTGRVKMPRRCGPRAGQGEFLFTGAVRFGEAWLGCAPLYKDFIRLYRAALDAGTNPCHIDTD